MSYKAFTQQTLFDGTGDTFKTLKDNAPTSHKASKAIDPEVCGKIKSKMETNEYYLKLCGSGGGGYMLGFTEDIDEARTALKDYKLEVVYNF